MNIKLFRIWLKGKISYSETETTVVDINTATKDNKRKIIGYIQSLYPNTCIREIYNGTFKAILEDGYLVGVQFDMNKLKS